jgi:hypothetical protein
MIVVLLGRSIFACVLSLVMIVSLAPANASECSMAGAKQLAASQGHECCKKSPVKQHSKKDGCGGVMECCRIIPVADDRAPDLAERTEVVEMTVAAPVVLHSLMTTESLFHPPRGSTL